MKFWHSFIYFIFFICSVKNLGERGKNKKAYKLATDVFVKELG